MGGSLIDVSNWYLLDKGELCGVLLPSMSFSCVACTSVVNRSLTYSSEIPICE